MARRKADDTPLPPSGPAPRELAALYSAKAVAELAAADDLAPDAAGVSVSGDPEAGILVVKGAPGPADLAEKRALAGPDGDALTKALRALELEASWLATCSRSADGSKPAGALERLALQIEAVDPAIIVALDARAAEDVADAAGLAELPFGRPFSVKGRKILAVDGLEASLGDESAKARVWAQLRTLRD